MVKDVGGTVTHFVFDLAGTLIAEADATGAVAREYIQIAGLPVAVIDADVVRYVHTDHLGAPQKITDAAKAVVWHGVFTPFGQELSITGALTANWRFPGQYNDAESALSYNYFRTYDPALGRYLQSDPIGLAGGLNTYSYVGGNPVNAVDPFGLDCVAVGQRVTCTGEYGQTEPFDRPADWPANMNSDSPRRHLYNIQVGLNGADAACVMQRIVDNPTPGQPSPATPEGTPNNATPDFLQNFGDLGISISSFGADTGGYNYSPVKSYVQNDGNMVVNVTERGHPLHPGVVVRTTNGSQVNNYGEGTSRLQRPGGLFTGLINGVWRDQTRGLISGCGCP